MNRRPPTGRHRHSLAFSISEILILGLLVTSIPAAQFSRNRYRASRDRCTENLRIVGQTIKLYHLTENRYPDAAFFAADPVNDSRSIARVLDDEGYGLDPQVWNCPSLPGVLRKREFGYLYNSDLAGKTHVEAPGKTWMMIEVSALATKLGKPHPHGYNILYADGLVRQSRDIPEGLKGAGGEG